MAKKYKIPQKTYELARQTGGILLGPESYEILRKIGLERSNTITISNNKLIESLFDAIRREQNLEFERYL